MDNSHGIGWEALSCVKILQARIFDGDKETQIRDDLIKERVKPNTLYYITEGNGNAIHPLCNLFYLHEYKKFWL